MMKKIFFVLVVLMLIPMAMAVVSNVQSPVDGYQFNDTYTFDLTCNATDVASDLQNISVYYMFNVSDPDLKTLVSYNGEDVTVAWGSRHRADSSSYKPNNSFDNDNVTRTQNIYTPVNETYPFYVGAQLNGTYNITEFTTIYFSGWYYCRNYTILTSTDNSSWDVVVNVTDYGDGGVLDTNVKVDRIVPSVEASYVMINCTAARYNADANGDPAISEILVYAEDGNQYKWIVQNTSVETGALASEAFSVTTAYIPNNLTWMCSAANSTHQINSSVSNLILAMDTVGPEVTQGWPLPRSGQGNVYDLYVDKDGAINFSYNVTDLTGIKNCSVYLNDTLQESNATEVTSGINWINVTGISDGVYSWLVGCYDNHTNENMGNSSERSIIVNSSTTLVVICGDSIIAGRDSTYSIDYYLESVIGSDITAINEGVGGEQVYEALSNISRRDYFAMYDADYYVLHWWTNDIYNSRLIPEIVTDIETMYDYLKTDDNEVILTAAMYADHSDEGGYGNNLVNTTSSNETTQRLIALAAEKNTTLVRWDLAMYKNISLYKGGGDGVHPNRTGNERLARSLYWAVFNNSYFNEVNSTVIYNYSKTLVGEYWIEISGIPDLNEPTPYINMSVYHANTNHMVNDTDGFWKNVTSDASGNLYIDDFNFTTGVFETLSGVPLDGEAGRRVSLYVISDSNDVTAPNITLVYPVANATLTNVNFTYNVSDFSNISYCELFTNGTVNTTLSTNENITGDDGDPSSSVNSNGNNRGFTRAFSNVNVTDGSNITAYVYYASHTGENYMPVIICNTNDTVKYQCDPGSDIYNYTFTLADYAAGNWLSYNFTDHNLEAGNVLVRVGINSTAKFAIGYKAGASNYETWYYDGSIWNNWTTSAIFYIRLGVYRVDGSYVFGLNETDTSVTKNISQNFNTSASVGDVIQWGVRCYDIGNSVAFSSANETITVRTDSDDPVVTPVSPAASASTTTTSTVFTYNPADVTDEIVSNCSLYLDDELNETDTTITESVDQTFSKNLSIGSYDWYVSCTDQTGNVGSSTERTLTIAEATSPEDSSNNEVEAQCTDRIDNDGDGLVDMNDPGCRGRWDDDESDDPVQNETFAVVINETLDNVTKGKKVEIDVVDENVTENKTRVVKKLEIIFSDDKTDVSVEVIETNVAPEEVASSVDKYKIKVNGNEYVAYQYIEVESDVEIEEATLQFEVSKEWMDIQKAVKEDVVLLHYINNSWVELETNYLEGDDPLVFEATTDGFSVFAVGVKSESEEFLNIIFVLSVVGFALIVCAWYVVVRKMTKKKKIKNKK
jgi:PGF-pre-PGF domain-containing protein